VRSLRLILREYVDLFLVIFDWAKSVLFFFFLPNNIFSIFIHRFSHYYFQCRSLLLNLFFGFISVV